MTATWLTETLGIEIPVLGAPMAGRAGGALVAEVTRGGGLGMLGAGYVTAEWLAREAAVAREAGPFGVGLMVWSLDEDDAPLDAALDERPAIVSLSFGDPAPYVDRVHAAGALALAQVNTPADLMVAEAAGVDVVVAQGAEAGGHTGGVATLPLLQQVLDATQLPVLAAGGIATGRGLAAVLAAGAQGAMVGTALLASPETTGPEYAVGRLLAADATDTVYTSVFDRARALEWPHRWGGRALVNRFTRTWHDAAGAGPIPDAEADELRGDYDPSDPDLGVVYAGQAAGSVTETLPAADVVRRIGADADALLARIGRP
ncbi:nitronate monooxygenase [Rhodococcus rhodnii]|uniref:2-nitropropane dioxygenase n=2 Tax=Rhodococcus rhodnii TaxID=38312 RepID=R7WMA4_9NOCA|nr:nitronate monooxygenase [Rhodococcus rhodnii]EOM76400.1 2-nitropropane dioxygenase [Rhodococcus rhodnii LMG 5362]TXG91524.1 nitronate monooxygenase [Rhodococcus rhodnii]